MTLAQPRSAAEWGWAAFKENCGPQRVRLCQRESEHTNIADRLELIKSHYDACNSSAAEHDTDVPKRIAFGPGD